MTRAAPLALAGLLWAGVAGAQPPDSDCFSRRGAVFQVDRPGEADGASVIPAGIVQFETGLRVSRETGDDDDPDVDSYTAPDLLLRLGLLRQLELRVSADGFVYQDRGGASNRARGSDFEVGAKVQFNCPELWRPAFGTIVKVSFPTGSAGVTSDGFDPTVELLMDFVIHDAVVATANLDFSAPTQGVDDDRRIFALEPQFSLDVDLPRNFGTYVEYFGKVQTGGVEDEQSVGGGFRFAQPGRFQFDLGASGGVDSGGPEWTITAGFSFRFQGWGD